MFGVIAWIRADGRKALVVVEGSPQMAVGDPGVPTKHSYAVGDLVFLPNLSQDMSAFGTGLTLIRGDYWPQIRREIGQIALAKPSVAKPGPRVASNVVPFQAQRGDAPAPGRQRRKISAAE